MQVTIDMALRHLAESGQPSLEVRDPNGTLMAYFVRADVMPDGLRPAQGRVPRRLRPKARLSKRQRDQAKRERLRPPVAS